jgi:hypothetical protein
MDFGSSPHPVGVATPMATVVASSKLRASKRVDETEVER